MITIVNQIRKRQSTEIRKRHIQFFHFCLLIDDR